MPLSLGLLNLTEEQITLEDLGTFLAPGSGTLVDFTGLYLPGEFRDSLSLFEQVVISGTMVISGSEGLLDQAEALLFFAGAQFAEQNFTVDGRDLREINNSIVLAGNNITVVSGTTESSQQTYTVSSTTDPAIAASGVTFQAEFTRQGAVNDTWLRYGGPVMPSNEAPFVVPWDSQLDVVTYTNGNIDSEVDIEIHKAAVGSGIDNCVCHTWEVRGERTSADSTVSASGIEFDAGERVAVFATVLDVQTRPENMFVGLYFRARLTASGQVVSENYTGDFS